MAKQDTAGEGRVGSESQCRVGLGSVGHLDRTDAEQGYTLGVAAALEDQIRLGGEALGLRAGQVGGGLRCVCIRSGLPVEGKRAQPEGHNQKDGQCAHQIAQPARRPLLQGQLALLARRLCAHLLVVRGEAVVDVGGLLVVQRQVSRSGKGGELG